MRSKPGFSQVAVLELLDQTYASGPLTKREIADWLGYNFAGAGSALYRLEARHWVERVGWVGKVRLWQITPLGQQWRKHGNA